MKKRNGKKLKGGKQDTNKIPNEKQEKYLTFFFKLFSKKKLKNVFTINYFININYLIV
tara:strand:- start:101 stop:274 length:174 start_codon:yes stop_codon:yes gene_type:complete